MNLKLRLHPDPFLRRKSVKIKNVKHNHVKTAAAMHDYMKKCGGIGLSSPQVGIEFAVIVMNTTSLDGVKRTLFNPEILERSEDIYSFKEGCLSIPQKFIEKNRPNKIKVKYLDSFNKEVIEEFEGISSICIQHEYDHLQGILMIDNLDEK